MHSGVCDSSSQVDTPNGVKSEQPTKWRSSTYSAKSKDTGLAQRRKKRRFLRRSQSEFSFQGVLPMNASFLFKIEDSIPSPVSCLILIADSSRIWMGTESGSILIWDKASISLERTIQFHSKHLTSILQIGNNVWVSSLDGTVSIWNQETLKQVKLLKIRSPVRSMITVGTSVWIGSDAKFYCYSNTMEKKKSKKLQSPALSMLFLHFRSEVWIGTKGDIYVYSIHGEKLNTLKGHWRKVNCLRNCDNHVWSGSSDGFLRVWDSHTHECLMDFDTQAPIYSFESDKNALWIVSKNGKLAMWDGRKLSLAYEVPRKVQVGAIICIKSLPVLQSGKVIGTNLWICSSDKIISVWKIETRSAFKEIV